MAIHYYISQKAELLRDCFIKNYKDTPRNIFKKDSIITQTEGLNEWISKGVTEQLGVFAHYEFTETNAFIRSIGKLFGIYLTNSSVQTYKWHLFNLLELESFKTSFPEIANYYKEDEVKRVQLAEKIAGLFDSYRVLREPYLVSWNNDTCVESETGNPNFIKHEAWQRWLWRALKNSISATSNRKETDSILFKALLIEKLKENSISSYNSISVIGITSLTAYNKEILNAISEHTDINYYLISPVKDLSWIREQTTHENSFLRSCKNLGRALFIQTVATANPEEITFLKHDTAEKPTLIEQVQQDLYNNTDGDQKQHDSIDNTITFASSYTEAREVEALYNYLLKQFETNKELEPKDVLIQLTDIDRYEPFINAVFDNAPVKIPYTVCNTEPIAQHSLTNAINVLFTLPAEDFKADLVLSLLEFSTVRKRFGIENPKEVLQLINAASIRFGTTGNKEDESVLMSWKHGLNRLILGTAIKGEEFITYNEETLLLCDAAEEEKALTVYRIKAFIDTVINLCETQQKAKSINEWIHFVLEEVIPSLFEVEDNALEELTSIQQKLHRLKFIETNNTQPISFEVFEQLALKNLAGSSAHTRYISGRVTFAGLVPTRTVPYKIHAILGLNGDTFPRQKTNLGFNLMDLEPKPGDKNPREGDQYVFLEAILSAKEQLYLSYIGMSSKNNKELPPSLLVEELQSYLRNKCGKETADKFTVAHPMHGFSHVYNQKNPQLYSYLNNPVTNEDQELEKEDFKANELSALSLAQLIQFFNGPIKWYYNKTLQIYYNTEDDQAEHTEIFELDHLQNWVVKNEVLSPEADLENFTNLLKAKGMLPLANMGEAIIENTQEALTELKEKINAFRSTNSPITLTKEITINNTSLKGTTKQVYNNTLLFYNLSKEKIKPKSLIEAWISHVFFIATNKAMDTVVLAPKEELKFSKELLSQERAVQILEELISFFKKGQKKPYLYTPKRLQKNDGKLDFIESILKDLKVEGTTDYCKDYKDSYIGKELENPYLKELVQEQESDLNAIKNCLFNELWVQ